MKNLHKTPNKNPMKPPLKHHQNLAPSTHRCLCSVPPIHRCSSHRPCCLSPPRSFRWGRAHIPGISRCAARRVRCVRRFARCVWGGKRTGKMVKKLCHGAEKLSFHGISMVVLWDFHGISMGSCDFHGSTKESALALRRSEKYLVTSGKMTQEIWRKPSVKHPSKPGMNGLSAVNHLLWGCFID